MEYNQLRNYNAIKMAPGNSDVTWELLMICENTKGEKFMVNLSIRFDSL